MLAVPIINPTAAKCVLHTTPGKQGLGIMEDVIPVPSQGSAALTLRWAPETAGGLRQSLHIRIGKGRTTTIVVQGMAQLACGKPMRPTRKRLGAEPRRPLCVVSGNVPLGGHSASNDAKAGSNPTPLPQTSCNGRGETPLNTSLPSLCTWSAAELLPPKVIDGLSNSKAPEPSTNLESAEPSPFRLLSEAPHLEEEEVIQAIMQISTQAEVEVAATALFHEGLLPLLFDRMLTGSEHVRLAALGALGQLSRTRAVAAHIAGASPSDNRVPHSAGPRSRLLDVLESWRRPGGGWQECKMARAMARVLSNLARWPECRASLCKAGAVADIVGLLVTPRAEGMPTDGTVEGAEGLALLEAHGAAARALYSLGLSGEGHCHMASLPLESQRALYLLAFESGSHLDRASRREVAKALLRERL